MGYDYIVQNGNNLSKQISHTKILKRYNGNFYVIYVLFSILPLYLFLELHDHVSDHCISLKYSNYETTNLQFSESGKRYTIPQPLKIANFLRKTHLRPEKINRKESTSTIKMGICKIKLTTFNRSPILKVAQGFSWAQ